MSSISAATSQVFVSYRLRNNTMADLMEAVIEVPSATAPQDIIGFIKQTIRPKQMPDPSDGYRGQDPSEVQITNMVNLSTLLRPLFTSPSLTTGLAGHFIHEW
jgi:hypothetical protein